MGEGTVFGLGIGFIAGMLFMSIAMSNTDSRFTATYSTIVSHGCAQYNQRTSEFEWLDTMPVPQDGVNTCVP